MKQWDDQSEMEQWRPPRGPIFKVVLWLILAMIALGSLVMLLQSF